MTGPRLVTGLITMGVVGPLVLFYLLGLQDFSDLVVLSATCFSLWGLADLVGSILSRPRLENRSPGDALKSIENLQKRANDGNEGGIVTDDGSGDQA